MELTQVQTGILTALINIQRKEERAIKGEEIANMIDRNPGTVRNQMQSLKALRLVEGVPGPKGGYRATADAYEVLDLVTNDKGVDVPVYKNGSVVEGVSASKISLVTIMNPNTCNGVVNIIGCAKDFSIGDNIEIGPTPVNKLYILGSVVGRDDIANRLIFDISKMIAFPNVTVRTVARHAITIDAETPLRDAARTMLNAKAQEALVEDAGLRCGLINLTDVARAAIDGRTNQAVKEFMSKDFLHIDADDLVYNAIKKLYDAGADQIVVIDSGVPWGIVSTKDLVRTLIHI
ncbi:MAG: CBS domain-containing protein [Methanothrix sp.]|nr:MAG: CBS domain-containing protein [Methanothrix sp.]